MAHEFEGNMVNEFIQYDNNTDYLSTTSNGIDLLSTKVSHAQISSACLSYRHDFGLMEGKERHRIMQDAVYWLEAWQKAMGLI